jgi:hypothetical protein
MFNIEDVAYRAADDAEGDALSARLHRPADTAIADDESIHIANSEHNRVRWVPKAR